MICACSLNIGFVVPRGSSVWLGGAEYIRNLAFAARAYCQSSGTGANLYVIGDSEKLPRSLLEELDAAEGIVPVELSGTQYRRTQKSASATRPNVVKRIGRRVRRSLGGSSAEPPRLPGPLENFVVQHELDFLYPVDNPLISGLCPTATWIPDLQHKYLPGLFSDQELASREAKYCGLIETFDTVVCSSRDVETDLHRFYSASRAKTSVLRFRVGLRKEHQDADPTAAVKRYCLPQKFFLACNQFWTHKNHCLLLRALRETANNHPDVALVLTGSMYDYRQPAYLDELMSVIHTSGLHAHVRVLGRIPKIDQIQLLRACHAVVQPSLFEGWSTIVEETRAWGKPVILSDLRVHREQACPRAVYFAPNRPEHLAEALSQSWVRGGAGWDPEKERAANAEYDKLFLEFGREICKLADARRRCSKPVSVIKDA